MSNTGPKKKRLTQKSVIEAIGTGKGFTERAKRRFAAAVVEELQMALRAGETPYPDSRSRREFIRDMQQLKKIADKIAKTSEGHPFMKAMIGAVSREMTDYGYRLVELDGVAKFAERVAHNADNDSFKNSKDGADTRYAYRLAYIIAAAYKLHFSATAAVTGRGENADGTPKQTPYQRVCSLVAEQTGVEIGLKTQREAIRDAESPRSKIPFKPDMLHLSEKK